MQPPVRPTRRAAGRPVPSLTHPFASVPNPALEAMRGQESARQRPAEGMLFNVPGGQVHVEMSIEGPLEIPVRKSPVSQLLACDLFSLRRQLAVGVVLWVTYAHITRRSSVQSNCSLLCETQGL